MKIDTVVFDLGGVLIDWNPRHLYSKLFADKTEMESFLTNVCHGEWNEQQDAGRPFSQAIDELIPFHPKYEAMIRAYRDRWPEMISGAIEGTVDVLSRIRETRRYRLYALTNWSAETFPLAQKRFEFLHWFEGVVVSGEEKMIKPDARFFKILETRHGVEPTKSVFIDDNLKNVTAADGLGYKTIRFIDPADLRSRLSDLGVEF